MCALTTFTGMFVSRRGAFRAGLFWAFLAGERVFRAGERVFRAGERVFRTDGMLSTHIFFTLYT
jgi:hypothetical protein